MLATNFKRLEEQGWSANQKFLVRHSVILSITFKLNSLIFTSTFLLAFPFQLKSDTTFIQLNSDLMRKVIHCIK